jgi:hypothetical protein
MPDTTGRAGCFTTGLAGKDARLELGCALAALVERVLRAVFTAGAFVLRVEALLFEAFDLRDDLDDLPAIGSLKGFFISTTGSRIIAQVVWSEDR